MIEESCNPHTKLNKINKPLSRLIKNRKRESQLLIIGFKELISLQIRQSIRIIRKYYKYFIQ